VGGEEQNMGAAREVEINFSLRLILEAYAPHQADPFYESSQIALGSSTLKTLLQPLP